ncbi:RICIN domain-containing protein [Streptomyces decoyicus]|uniref:RICIN domain-containing protein n=1 Tax=Streptomyces decoyicus TaxID=249567 RepID=UPI00363F2856
MLVAFSATAFMAATISPLGTGQAQAAEGDCAKELECLVVASEMEDDARVLEIARGWHGDGADALGRAYIFPNKNSENQRWEFRNTGDGSFQMVVRDSKKCLSTAVKGWSGEQDCSNTVEQKWYLQPVPSGGFMIRSVKDDMCLNGLGGHSGQDVYKSNRAGTYTCASGDDGSVFNIYDLAGQDGLNSNTRAMMTLAAEYAMTKCDKDQSYCKWETTQKGEPTRGKPICRGNPVRNPGPGTASTKFLQTETSINSETVGGFYQNSEETGVEVTLGKPDLASLKITNKFAKTWQSNYARTVGEQKTWSQEVTRDIPANQWGWMEETPMTRLLTGKFVFAQNDWAQWEFNGDSANPMTTKVVLGGDGSSNNSLWEVKIGPNPPTNC